MTNTEAINCLEFLIEAVGFTDKGAEPIRMAIAALKEKEERDEQTKEDNLDTGTAEGL